MHSCDYPNLRAPVKTFYSYRHGGSSESLSIRRCGVCGQLWKIRFQSDQGTGRDDIWLRPGQSDRGYEFTHEEAKEFDDSRQEGDSDSASTS